MAESKRDAAVRQPAFSLPGFVAHASRMWQ
jgi:hypothetical protein